MRFGLETASDAVIMIATEYVNQPINKTACWSPLANGGVRIEDVVLVTKTGCKNLVVAPKVLEIA